MPKFQIKGLVTANYCLYCNKPCSHKFCSNSGSGNCKDAYHNRKKDLAQLTASPFKNDPLSRRLV